MAFEKATGQGTQPRADEVTLSYLGASPRTVLDLAPNGMSEWECEYLVERLLELLSHIAANGCLCERNGGEQQPLCFKPTHFILDCAPRRDGISWTLMSRSDGEDGALNYTPILVVTPQASDVAAWKEWADSERGQRIARHVDTVINRVRHKQQDVLGKWVRESYQTVQQQRKERIPADSEESSKPVVRQDQASMLPSEEWSSARELPQEDFEEVREHPTLQARDSELEELLQEVRLLTVPEAGRITENSQVRVIEQSGRNLGIEEITVPT
ncbi:MAG: hypothetical protein ACLF0G_17465, partial [Candidatus Brocadiia bacterium]